MREARGGKSARARIARRVGSASAPNVTLSESAICITHQLSNPMANFASVARQVWRGQAHGRTAEDSLPGAQRQGRPHGQGHPPPLQPPAPHLCRQSPQRSCGTVLVADLDIRVIDDQGEVIRQLRLDPSRNYQPLGRS